jgi:hypothetical protein
MRDAGIVALRELVASWDAVSDTWATIVTDETMRFNAALNNARLVLAAESVSVPGPTNAKSENPGVSVPGKPQ